MSISFSLPGNITDFILMKKEDYGSWDLVRNNEDLLNAVKVFLGKQITMDEWNDEVHRAIEVERSTVEFKRLVDSLTLSDSSCHIIPSFPQDGYWREYYDRLCEKFSIISAQMIRESCVNIISHLSLNEGCHDQYREPIKGAVFGSVQSGKTANMEGIIAMGCDVGFNVFVILSGNLKILRDQTRNRLDQDFSGRNQLNFIDVNSDIAVKPNQKNVIVCLKTPGSLKKLHNIITKNEIQRRKLRVVVMDDEGDLATVDSSSESAKQRATINRHIMSIVNCCPLNKPDEPYSSSYEAMNYISYTATPFAVLLNESTPESLYPRDFIISIPTSNHYFGPCQIFGCNHASCQYDGLPIINHSDRLEKEFKNYESDPSLDEPTEDLKDAICWFICCTAILRINRWRHPVSMLINTNSRIDQHHQIGKKILNYLKNNAVELEERCEAVFHEQCEKFSIEDLRQCYPEYHDPDFNEHLKKMINYPNYDQIRDVIHEIFQDGAKQIPIIDEDPVFDNGIHVCIEDSSREALEDTPYEIHSRLLYPEGDCGVDAPAFLAIGGNALSRGFTLEGLVSTFFIRPVTQADTLMQMGRWFGYREGYELLPRVWMSTQCLTDFEFLADLDADLREEIILDNQNKLIPSEFARRMLAVPNTLRLKRLTAKNKSKGMEYAEFSYSGKRQEFANFLVKEGLFDRNLNVTKDFLNGLSEIPGVEKDDSEGLDWGNVVRWQNVPLDDILNGFIRKFDNGMEKGDCYYLEQWMNQVSNNHVLESWTVVLVGQHGGKKFSLRDGSGVGMIVRGKEKGLDPSVIRIKTLWSKSDYFRDIFPKEIPDLSIQEKIRSGKYGSVFDLRQEERQSANRLDTPSIFIYCIDGKGKSRGKNKLDLDLDQDVIAFFVDIPRVTFEGDRDRVRVKLDPSYQLE